ncbi:hypothetical protein F3J20_04245 [Paraburkholderia sp. Cy-641]|uniref:hypothetical protein n=1 Tax=Paraburkholderia sp. Cy-641 TaxID=2608337 RepID=UPI00141FCA8B|nr:hypothetical protein [Paraburkholderia sp. Cy-641]NIF76615.1 hypothetical protein [Paraburkholderia sp. Cy-641]
MVLMICLRLNLQSAEFFSFPENFAVNDTESYEALHGQLISFDGYVCSEYCGGDHPSGMAINHIRHEALQKLTFEDD